MAETTKIEWADKTFNPWEGCMKVSPGCANCYAETRASRFGVVQWGPLAAGGTRRLKAESGWSDPVTWNTEAAAAGVRPRVFCASLADVFEEWAGPISTPDGGGVMVKPTDGHDPDRWQRVYPDTALADQAAFTPVTMDDVRSRLFALIDVTPALDWLLLTKRPQNIARMMPATAAGFPRPNVWLGTTVENRAATARVDALRSIPAAVRFLSAEPLLEDLGELDLTGIGWVIAGGESGFNARPMHPTWPRSLRDRCRAAGVAFHFKQWGEWIEARDAPEPEAVPTKVLAGTAAECTVMKKPARSLRVVRPDGGDRVFLPDGHFTGDGPGQGDAWMVKVGKRDAGRLLEGREWNEFPTPVRANEPNPDGGR